MNFLNMSFHNGTTRFVVTIPWLGIALKFAHIHPIKALETSIRIVHIYTKRGEAFKIPKKLSYSDEVPHFVLWQFRGVYANIREYRFYVKSKNPFLWPTFFSFFGLINVQPFAQLQPKKESDPALRGFVSEMTNDEYYRDSHTFIGRDNYVIDSGGYLRMLDYGSTAGQEIINKYGHRLYTQSRQLFS